MCSRYCLTASPSEVRSYFNSGNQLSFPPRYNIAPTQPVAIVRHTARGERELALVRWGLIPAWVKDPGDFSLMINARSETASEKPSFRAAMRYRRCLVPLTGFYEWTGVKGAKQPHLIALQSSGEDGTATTCDPVTGEICQPDTSRLFAMAGIWENWLGADGSEIETMAILTTKANKAIGAIHDRMPVLIRRQDFARWLDCSMGAQGYKGRGQDGGIANLLGSAPADLLEIRDVNPKLNNPRNEGSELHDKVRAIK